MSRRDRKPGVIRAENVGIQGPDDSDWIQVNVSDGSWTKLDEDSTCDSIAWTGTLNQAVIDTTQNSTYVNGCVFYKEILTPTGQRFNYADAPVTFEGYIHWPSVSYATTDGATTGGDDRPIAGGRCYTLMGLSSDMPDNYPTPVDLVGCGIESQSSTSRLYRVIVRNTQNDGSVVSTNKTGYQTVQESEVSAGKKATNRQYFTFNIMKEHQQTAGTGSSIQVADSPHSSYLLSAESWSNGERNAGLNSYAVGQRWGRGHLDRLYVWVAIGRGVSGASGTVTLDFDCYYNVRNLTGVNPSGEDNLS